MTVVGYARVSTDHQSLEAQQDALRGAGAERVFIDKLPAARDDRPGLAALLDHVRAGEPWSSSPCTGSAGPCPR